ncbi:MAG: cupin domain-containing protein [Alphaproteobacteria bacterium]|nr:cupin domain-containing protein [Alphaproteobacteria bacterium]
MTAPAVHKAMADCPAFRISPRDTNYFALVFDPQGEEVDLVCVVEIFQQGGKTPPNVHQRAEEMFFVLKGEGVASCGGTDTPIRAGDALLLRRGQSHVIANTGTGKLYTLTVMVPNEDFAELIRKGTPVALDAEDRAVIAGLHRG